MAETIGSKYTFKNANLDTQKIKFLSGAQSSLNTLITNGGATEGAFYLTTDTHRLYIGRTIEISGSADKTIPIPVNEGIATVSSISDLNSLAANVGEFYYVEEGNILAVKAQSGTGAQYWVQLNNDTNDTIAVTSASLTKKATQDNNAVIKYTLTINQTKTDKSGNTTSLSAVTTDLSIAKADIQAAINVGIESSAVSSNSTTLSLSGDGADTTKSVTITGAGSVTLSGAANNITITGANTTYSLGSAADSTNVTLTDSGSNTTSVNFTAGANLSVDGATAGQITYSHAGPGSVSGSAVGNNGNSATKTVALGETIRVPKITKDANGHIVSATDTTITLSNGSTITGVNANDVGNIVLTTQGGNSISSSDNAPSGKTGVLFNTITIDGSEVVVYNQGDFGSFYSKTAIDNLMRDLNAMTYKGTVGTNESSREGSILPTSNIKIGDTYLADMNGNIYINQNTTYTYPAGQSGKKGDLYIATGTEDSTTGYITGIITWTRVESGDIDTQYSLSSSSGATNPSIQLNIKGTLGETDGSVQLIGGTAIGVTSGSGNDGNKITINHDNSGVTAGEYGDSSETATLGPTSTFNIPNFTVDAQGHVTSASTKEYTLATNYSISNESASNAYDSTIRLANGLTGAGSIQIAAKQDLTSDPYSTLQITPSNGKIEIGHKARTVTNSAPAADAPAETLSEAFNVVTGLTTDAYGHTTAVSYKKYNLPTALTYTLGATTAQTGNTLLSAAGWALSDSGSTQHGAISLTSDTLKFKYASANSYNVDLVWGSF